jgi:hypothetical protein
MNSENQNKTENKIIAKEIGGIGYKTLFSNDKYLMYIHKKSHSISRAVYLITDFFDPEEPMKIKMRQLATELVSQVLSLSVELSPGRKSLLDGIIKSGLSMISFSEIAMFSGIESEMNHSILTEEIENLLSVIEQREVPSRLGRHFVLDDSMLIKETYSADQESTVSASTVTNQTNINSNMANNVEKSTNYFKSHSNHSNKPDVKKDIPSNKSNDDKKNDRRITILSIIKNKGQSSIKDITDVITGCSEKTIQRELLDMVSSNVLKKEGDRRWTRYSIANHV